LLGTGPQEIKLKSIVKSDQIRNVTFAGKQFNMGDWFEAADFLIHPSYTEGLGSVILEAIKAELPVIGTRAGGIPDIIENEVTGLLVEPKDEQALAAAIVRLHSDSQLRNRLIEGGNDKLKFFDISYTSQQYRDLYKKLQQ
jgi:glycosyltransferase involved in cell wall biosynthesis